MSNPIISQLPNFVKVCLRLVKYKAEWKKQIREIAIIRQQNKYINSTDKNIQFLIVFLTPGAEYYTGKDKISGGVLSIFSIFKESEKIINSERSKVLMCTLKKEHLIFKYSSFENSVKILRYSLVSKHLKAVNKFIIHVPEMYLADYIKNLNKSDLVWIEKIKDSQLNILNQNISLMPGLDIIASAKSIFGSVTITTAHQQYATNYYQDLYGVPLHKLSVWISPEQYHFESFEKKKNLLVVSPDYHPDKEKILERIRSSFPELEVLIIQNLTYENYKMIISEAKWSLTFGEGLDGYFIEPVFSGAVSFAIYNKDFFTDDFKSLKTVYINSENLYKKLCEDILLLNTATRYKEYQRSMFDICAKHYSIADYQSNLKMFYERKYTFSTQDILNN